MRNMLMILGAALFFVACNRRICPEISASSKDSIITNVITEYKDTPIYIPGKVVTIHDEVPCPEVDYHREEKTDGLKGTVDLHNGTLNVKCEADSLRMVIKKLQQRTVTDHWHNNTITITKTVTVTKYKVPKWCWWLLAGNILLIAYLFRNPLRAFIQALIYKWTK